jgi:hypothetical protein
MLVQDPVLTHYARCMRRGLGKECLHLKKGASSKKNKCASTPAQSLVL